MLAERPEAKYSGRQRTIHHRGERRVKELSIDAANNEVVEGERAEPVFGQDRAIGAAVLERILEADRNLLYGVVPYDPPKAPPTDPVAGGTSFSLSSCQYPAGFFDAAVAYRSYAGIVGRLKGTSDGIRPRFLLFVGDQVYVDPTAGFFDPANKDDRYRLPYENWLRQPYVRDALRRVPSFMLLDDHEIDDNWEPVADPDHEENQEKRACGVAQFQKYQRGLESGLETFHFDGFHFFMLDTRTGRSHRKVDTLASAKMFAPATMERLQHWLLTAPGPKFVVSPHMLLPRHGRAVQRDARLDPANLSALHSDGWDGYPDTLREVLGWIAKKRIGQVVFLSGDEHRGCIATARLMDAAGNQITTIHSIHTAGMYAPYPFANSIDQDIVPSELFELTFDGDTYGCAVEAMRPAPRDGPTYFFVRQVDSGGWRLDCQFGDSAPASLDL
jgi:hypothetical protein